MDAPHRLQQCCTLDVLPDGRDSYRNAANDERLWMRKTVVGHPGKDQIGQRKLVDCGLLRNIPKQKLLSAERAFGSVDVKPSYSTLGCNALAVFGLALQTVYAVTRKEMPTRRRIVTDAVDDEFSVAVLLKSEPAINAGAALKCERTVAGSFTVDQHIHDETHLCR